MKRQIDLLFGGVLLAVLLAAMAPSGRTSFSFRPVEQTVFPDVYLVTSLQGPLEPSPEVYQRLGKMGRIVIGQYSVSPKDSLASLAREYGSTVDYLRSTNRLESLNLAPGKTLWVHNGMGMLHQVRESKGKVETLNQVAARYNRPAKKIAAVNRLPGVALLSEKWVQPGSMLFIPNAHLRFTDYALPVGFAPGKRLISSGFGYRRHPILRHRRFHSGWDMPRPYGFPVKASREGRVIFAGWRGGFGRLIIVKHANGFSTWYGHLSQIRVASGQKVRKGQVIGNVGSTGLSTGPHLHFEVRDRFGNSLNPRKFLF